MPKVTSQPEKELLVSIRKYFIPYKYWKPWDAKIYKEALQVSPGSSTKYRKLDPLKTALDQEGWLSFQKMRKLLLKKKKAYKRRGNKHSDSKTTGQAWNRCELLPCAKIASQMGWTLQRTHYCQLIRVANKVKRLEYAQQILDSGNTFHNVIFSDEC